MRQWIDTARLRLRPVTAEEARAVVAGDLSGLDTGEGYPHADTGDAMAMTVSHGVEPGWFVTLEGEIIGDCGTHGEVDGRGAVEIGYGLAEPFRGKGYGTEVVEALTQWLLGQPGVRLVTTDVLADNVASRRVLEKTGFTLAGAPGDHVVYTCGPA